MRIHFAVPRRLAVLGRFLLDVAQVAPLIAGAIVLLRVLRALQPVAVLYVGKLIVDAVLAVAAAKPAAATLGMMLAEGALTPLLVLVGIELLLVVGVTIASRLSGIFEMLLSDIHANDVSRRVIAHAASLDLVQLESSECQDLAMRARTQSFLGANLLGQALNLAQNIVTVLTLVGGVVAFAPWVVALLLLAMVPALLGEAHFNAKGYQLEVSATPARREIEYMRFIGSSPETVKEIKLFGLGSFLAERFAVLSRRILLDKRKLAIQRGAWGVALSSIGSLAYYAAYGLILWRVVEGELSVGGLVFLSGALLRLNGLFETIMVGFAQIAGQSRSLNDLFTFFELKPATVSAAAAVPFPCPVRQGIRFENVGFRYPGKDIWAVRGLNFELGAGESLALVGANGAGKTTIVKLLARLYDPDEGRITVDGTDLRDIDLDGLRAQISVVFQDFVRYHLSAGDNIGIGDVAAMTDTARVARAADAGLARELIRRLPRGFAQPLGRRFEDGVELSGGEWQKIATARAYMRDAAILILDEPTAALDPRAEIEVFERLKALSAGRSTLIISHRFSTVRMADRILVLADGKVQEMGSHDELLALGGVYAELFDMQAAGYR